MRDNSTETCAGLAAMFLAVILGSRASRLSLLVAGARRKGCLDFLTPVCLRVYFTGQWILDAVKAAKVPLVPNHVANALPRRTNPINATKTTRQGVHQAIACSLRRCAETVCLSAAAGMETVILQARIIQGHLNSEM